MVDVRAHPDADKFQSTFARVAVLLHSAAFTTTRKRTQCKRRSDECGQKCFSEVFCNRTDWDAEARIYGIRELNGTVYIERIAMDKFKRSVLKLFI